MVHYYLAVATANIVLMSYSNSSPAPHGDEPGTPGFNTQSQLGLAEVLQMCCGARRSGQITFRSGESCGYVYLQHGNVLHALCGTVEGEDAVYRMLGWPGGGFSINQDILPHKKTVGLTWEQLIFEGARRADDGPNSARDILNHPVKTPEPVVSTRAKDSQPKLTLILPDQRPLVHELQAEYTHVGRAPGNEVPLIYPSVSNRHCIFILNGSDVILRDLNSSNGTIVNGVAISEAVLRPGDLIQVGVVQIRFEPGVRRPKLTQTTPAPAPLNNPGLRPAPERLPAHNTVRLPEPRPTPQKIEDDSVFVKGESPISYERLAKPEAPAKSRVLPMIVGALIIVLAISAAGYYFFVVLAHH